MKVRRQYRTLPKVTACFLWSSIKSKKKTVSFFSIFLFHIMFLWYLRDVERFGRFKTKLWCRKMPQISTHKSLTQSQLRWLSKQNNWSIIQSRKSWKSNWHWNWKSDYVEAPESRYSISRQERNLWKWFIEQRTWTADQLRNLTSITLIPKIRWKSRLLNFDIKKRTWRADQLRKLTSTLKPLRKIKMTSMVPFSSR